MNGTARQVLRDLRQGVIDRSPALLVTVLRWALVVAWMVYGPVWMVGLMARPDYALEAFLLVSLYLTGKAMWSLWSAMSLFPRDDRVHRELAAMVQRAERW